LCEQLDATDHVRRSSAAAAVSAAAGATSTASERRDSAIRALAESILVACPARHSFAFSSSSGSDGAADAAGAAFGSIHGGACRSSMSSFAFSTRGTRRGSSSFWGDGAPPLSGGDGAPPPPPPRAEEVPPLPRGPAAPLRRRSPSPISPLLPRVPRTALCSLSRKLLPNHCWPSKTPSLRRTVSLLTVWLLAVVEKRMAALRRRKNRRRTAICRPI
ncbi:hypothetical protein CLOM_g17077, partial [Closterium sp. NIES-68]